MMGSSKIFGIGFHKTGTSSLAAALSQLGYRVTGPQEELNPTTTQHHYEKTFKLVDEHDAFQDNPWPILYKELDQKYPGSKFILTLRSTDSWIKSVVRHFGTNSSPMREWIYGIGYPKGNEAIYIARYEQHNKDVLNYFKDRSDDLLVLRITEGEGWQNLCSFLDRESPETDFPHLNKANVIRKIRRSLRRTYHKLHLNLRIN